MNELNEVIILLEKWKAFKEQGGKGLNGFGNWLTKDEPQEQTVPATPPIDSNLLNIRLSILFIYLERYKNTLMKKVLDHLPLRTVEEFLLLSFVEREGNPIKSDFLKSDFMRAAMIEKTTIFEMIKRLQKDGLLLETADTKDKRSKRLSLTEQGKVVMRDSRIAFSPVNTLLYANLTTQDKLFLMKKFQYLCDFHEHLHRQEQLDDLAAVVEKYIELET
ncbi:winged helix DNA-binding protein [Limibacter armeniacum]|uniref:winged helix DNA-binding protein n=1 Tax=Limibacter armeniacum TaxID=466084 RepID=UPI002FE66FA7